MQFDRNDLLTGSIVTHRYCCTKCGFRNDVGEPDWMALKRSGVPPEQPSRPWDKCPDDGGPDTGFLTSPDRRSQRFRTPFVRGGSVIRLCTPMVLSKGRGAAVRVRARLNADELQRELHLEERLASQGLLPGLSLSPLAGLSGRSAFYIAKVGSHWTRALEMFESYEHDPWANRALSLGPGYLDRPGFLPLDLARAIDPRLGSRALDLDQTLYVPVHIGHSLEEQLQSHLVLLREVRDYLRRFTEERPIRARPGTVYRDVYIFMRHWISGWTDARIASDVFPGERKRSATTKVRQVLLRVRKAIDKAGLQLPPRRVTPRGSP